MYERATSPMHWRFLNTNLTLLITWRFMRRLLNTNPGTAEEVDDTLL